jgi:hypothetical protein
MNPLYPLVLGTHVRKEKSGSECRGGVESFYNQGCRVSPMAFEVREQAEKGTLMDC